MNQEIDLLNNKGEIRLFVDEIFANLDISQSAINDYRSRIGVFLNFVANMGFNNTTFIEFKRWLRDSTNYSVSTKNKHLTVARIFLKEMNKQGLISADITSNIHSFQQSKKHKVAGLTKEEVEQIFNFLEKLSEKDKTRLTALFSVLLFQGYRTFEVCNINVEDIDFIGKTIRIKGKARDDTELTNAHPKVLEALKEYLKIYNLASGPVFTSQSKSTKGQRLSTRGLRSIVKAVFEELKIEKAVHSCRHYFVTRLIEVFNSDLIEIAKYSRHRSLEMLRIYDDNYNTIKKIETFYEAF